MSRLDALVAREKDGKTYWTKIGAAFPNKNGGYKVILEALPMNGEIILREPLPARGSKPERGDAFEGGDDGQPWG